MIREDTPFYFPEYDDVKEVRVTFENIKDSIYRADIDGFIGMYNAYEFEKLLNNFLRDHENCRIVFNWEKVDRISSAGIGVFLKFFRDLNKQNGIMSHCNMKSEVSRVFELVGFSKIFAIEETFEEALKAIDF